MYIECSGWFKMIGWSQENWCYVQFFKKPFLVNHHKFGATFFLVNFVLNPSWWSPRDDTSKIETWISFRSSAARRRFQHGFRLFMASWIQSLSEKVRLTLQIIVNYTPVPLLFRRYDWIHRDGIMAWIFQHLWWWTFFFECDSLSWSGKFFDWKKMFRSNH